MNAPIDTSRPVQRTEAGLKYEKYRKNLEKHVFGDEAAHKEAVDEIIACKEGRLNKTLAPGDVQVSTVLSNLSVQYANDEYIGTRLMPTFDQGKRFTTYYEYDKRNRLAYPDDSMDVRTKANEINETRSKKTVSLEGRALKEFVDQTTINSQDAVLNEMMDAQEAVLDGLLFKQEQRIATIMTTSGNFGANTTAIGAGDRWDVGGDPRKPIDNALAALWKGRGSAKTVAFMSLNVWNKTKVNSFLLDQIRVDNGMLTLKMFAEMFGFDEVLIGAARQDAANSGQTASYTRIWSDVFGIARVATVPSKRNAVFGYTFRENAPKQRMWFDPSSGEEGGWYTQASQADLSKVVAADTGYLITTPIG